MHSHDNNNGPNNSFLGIAASDLKGHAGKIQAVLATDLTHSTIHGMDVLFEGINGVLPNLDLLHLVFRVGRSEGVPIKLHYQVLL